MASNDWYSRFRKIRFGKISEIGKEHTFAFLTAFGDSQNIAREYMGSIMLIHEFATLSPVFLNREGKAAVRIMSSLLDSFVSNHISYDCPHIQVEDEEGNFHQIDVNTFDLSELL